MNKSELVEAVAERAGTDRAVARRHVDAVFEAIIDTVTAGDRVLVTGFGTFDRFARPARTARNPRTGQAIEVAAADVPRFRVGQTFKNRVAQGNGAPAPAGAAVPEPAAPATEGKKARKAEKTEKSEKPKKGKKESKEAAAKEAAARKNGGKKAGGKKKAASGKKAAKAR
ncbi:HU family DNA-binding protein [Actinomadura sp. 21ATH]|uniref:HU family DNA-binding protein n=1 Tax=Actinomadura sp. 21ATH TaxID=1735444 RepID=UPI0035C08801